MSLDLNQKCMNRLIASLAGKLQTVLVNNGVFIDFQSMVGVFECEAILPSVGKQENRLAKYIGDRPFFDFVFETISRNLYESHEYDSASAVIPLSSVPGYANLEVTAKQLVGEFNSLPWRFIVSFELNASIGQTLRNHEVDYAISDRIRLVSPDQSIDEKLPLLSNIEGRDKNIFSGYGLFANFKKREWNKETSYLQFDIDGFIGKYTKTTPIEEVISSIKSFFGLSLAVNFLRVKEKGFESLFDVAVKSYLIVHKVDQEKPTIWSTFELSPDISEILSKVEVNDLDGHFDSSKIEGWIKNRLGLISAAFRNLHKAEKVLLAGEWLLDSYAGKNELLSFVQTTVAMEILLGEKATSDIIGIGELLRNRCAYLIGKTHSQREEVLENFKKIYDVRSGIVHRGKSRLTSNERALFVKLQWMCQRVITEEIKLIIEDEKKSA